MLLTPRQEQVLARYFRAQLERSPDQVLRWFLDLVTQSKAQQLQALRDWIDAERAANTRQVAELDTHRARAEQALADDAVLLAEVRDTI